MLNILVATREAGASDEDEVVVFISDCNFCMLNILVATREAGASDEDEVIFACSTSSSPHAKPALQTRTRL